ncbi:glutamate-gated chloride channel alpha-like isoform X2 [Centruroides sculpturatus]|nr:glutamate-gated chloride channel alpha-like isoform X2 [Centruroides sculpturatus]
MDVRHYPLDTQRCPLILCSYSLTDKELELVWDESTIGVEIYPDAELTEFELLSPVRTGIRKLHYKGADVNGLFSCVNATFRFKRQNSYHLMYSYMLTTFIVIVSWMSFWLDVTAVPGRVSLGVTTLLTLTTSAGNIRERLPPVAYVTAIDVWVGFCSFFVFTALLEFPLANYISRRPIPNPNSKKRLFVVKKQLQVKDATSGNLHVVASEHKDKSEIPTAVEEARTLDRACRVLYPLLFIVFNSIYWPYYISAAKLDENNT